MKLFNIVNISGGLTDKTVVSHIETIV